MSSFLLKKIKDKTFEEKISNRSKRTREIFVTVQKSFNQFCIESYEDRPSKEIFEELHQLKQQEQTDALFDILQGWIDWNYDRNVLTSTLKMYFSKLKTIFHYEGFKIHPQDIKDNLIWKKKIREELHALQMNEIRQILSAAKYKKRAFYLALLSTGARPGELLQITKKDFDLTTSRVKITIHPEGSKTGAGRSVYLTREAARYTLPILKTKKDDELVYARRENTMLAEKSESKTFSRYVDNAGFTERYHSNNYRKITLYSFRSFFFGKCADIHREGYAHKMTGHGGYLPQYDRMDDERKIQWFADVEPELTVDLTEKYKLDLESQKRENNTNGEEIAKLKTELAQIKAFHNWVNQNTTATT
jgi:integrase